jgi:phospholipid/cholesterol/gamma-HCH transport system substrate-binding protein
MSHQGIELKVGLFVAIGLLLLGGLLLRFSQTASLFSSSYEVVVKTSNVGGIKNGAAVLMAGVSVGNVRGVELTPDGRSVLIHLRILAQHKIHADAQFVIEQAGFLGDQYVAIIPGPNAKPLLKDGDLVSCEAPFNLQEAARAVSHFLVRIDQTAQEFNNAVARLDRTILSETNLENVTVTLANFRAFSERAGGTVANLDAVVTNNAPIVAVGISNLVVFSHQLNGLAANVDALLATNGAPVGSAVSNLESATLDVRVFLDKLQAGQGLAGTLFHDTNLQNQFALTVSNLSVVSSNLARFGLLYKPKPVKPPKPERMLTFPPRPF